MTNKNILKIGLVLGVLVLSFVALPSFHKANAIICDTCGGGGGGGGGGATIPIAPTLNSANAGSSGQVSVNFTDNSSDETGFYVYRNSALVATLAAITGTGTASVYTDTGMACGSTYTYNVSAYNSAGSASSASLSVAVKCPPTAPTINSYGATSDTAVSFTYTLTSVIDYLYLFRDSAIYASSGQSGVGNGTVFTSYDSGLACGSTHTYFVRVGNGLNTADSVPFNITTNTCAPAAPTLTSVTAASQTQLNVNFTNNDTRALGQVGFYVYRDGSATALNSVGFGVNPSSAYTYSDTGVTCGSTHSYKIGAVNSGVWTYSGILSGTASACVAAPAPVSSLTATTVSGTPSANSSWSVTANGVYVYLKGPSGYSLLGNVAGTNAISIGGLRCPFPYIAYYVPYNTDTSVSGTDASCSSALSNAGISGPAAPTGARCAAASQAPINMSFCTQQFLGN